MPSYGDTVNFDKQGIINAVSSLREAGGEMVKLKDAFQSYKTDELDIQWKTAGGQIALGRLQSFIDVEITNFINYIQGPDGNGGKVEELESILNPIDKINNA